MQKILNTAPENGSANYLLGLALLQTGQATTAVGPLRIALSTNPQNLTAAGYLGDAEMEAKDYASAAKTFEDSVVNSSGSERSLVWWTDFALERFRELEFSLRASSKGRAELLKVAAENPGLDLKTRQSLLIQAAALNPNADGVWGELGVTQFELGSMSDARTSLAKALEASPKATATIELQCLMDASNNKWSEALSGLHEIAGRSTSDLQKFLDTWPNSLFPASAESNETWGCVRRHSASCVTAAVPQQHVSLVPRDLFDQGRWDALTGLPAPQSASDPQWFWRGMAYAESGACHAAIPALERGITSWGEVAAAHLANCYRTEVVEGSDRLKAEGKEASVHKIRGDILLSVRLDPAQAATEYRAALQLRPEDPEIQERLVEAYFSEGELGKAKVMADTAIKLNPQRTQLVRLVVRIDMGERDYAEAIPWIDRLLEAQPDNSWAHVQKATADSQIGRPAEAALELKTALDTGYPDAKGSLHALLAAQLRKLGRIEDSRRATAAAIQLADSYQKQAQQSPDN